MITGIIISFILGYLLIILEHPLRLDKSIPALVAGATCWALASLGGLELFDMNHVPGNLKDILGHHTAAIAEILFFLLGAMTIVEVVDLHRGFAVITNRIQTKSVVKLLWLVSLLAFFLSATLDNLAATIVMVSLLRKLISDRTQRLYILGVVVIAANAGGAWSPIGDVTTTMLWMKDRVSTVALITNLFLPSVMCIVVPLIVVSFQLKGKLLKGREDDIEQAKQKERVLGSRRMLAIGMAGLVFVPIFKIVTHLPPYVGMVFSLGIVWLVSELIHRNQPPDVRHEYSVHKALSKIEITSILFFLGILLAVAALESVGVLAELAHWLDSTIPNQRIIVILLGLFSAVIDNVPLVAASISMYDVQTYPMDTELWHFIAYCAGTGGSVFIIGSAAGVAAMGMERIDFIWYAKKLAWLALIGYFAGIVTFIGIRALMTM